MGRSRSFSLEVCLVNSTTHLTPLHTLALQRGAMPSLGSIVSLCGFRAFASSFHALRLWLDNTLPAATNGDICASGRCERRIGGPLTGTSRNVTQLLASKLRTCGAVYRLETRTGPGGNSNHYHEYLFRSPIRYP
jgi:hypothetical protein